ncbi:MAG: phosphatase [Gammaproteobacteria bacterium]|nr:phosphatase [Gammaproteobacteria bacterium]
MNQNDHAIAIANRFKEIYEQSGESFSQEHLDELSLLIEAGLDAAILQKMEKIADQLTSVADGIRHNAEFTSPE